MEHRDPSTAETRVVPPPPDDGSATRRGFLGLMTMVLGAVPVVGGLLTLRSGLAPQFNGKPKKIPLCKLDEVPADGIKEIAISYQARQGPVLESVAKVVFVTKDENGKVLAMAGECTHLACPVQKKPMKLAGKDGSAPLSCPCHGGAFSRTGDPVAGPPKLPLRRLTLEEPKEAEGMIYLLDS